MPKNPKWRFLPTLDYPYKFNYLLPMTWILQAGILDNASIPPVAPINYAAIVVPQIFDTFGAMYSILLSIYFNS